MGRRRSSKRSRSTSWIAARSSAETLATGWRARASLVDKYRPQLVWFRLVDRPPRFYGGGTCRNSPPIYYNQGAGGARAVAVN